MFSFSILGVNKNWLITFTLSFTAACASSTKPQGLNAVTPLLNRTECAVDDDCAVIQGWCGAARAINIKYLDTYQLADGEFCALADPGNFDSSKFKALCVLKRCVAEMKPEKK